MLVLCSMLSGTYYAYYYASIIGRSLQINLTTIETVTKQPKIKKNKHYKRPIKLSNHCYGIKVKFTLATVANSTVAMLSPW